MEKLKYIIEDSKIAELLGIGNFSNKESAVLELVKNAYDAGASEVKISFIKDENDGMYLEVSDDGNGMNHDDIKNKWMHVGKSNKKYLVSSSSSKPVRFKKVTDISNKISIDKTRIIGFKNARIAAGSMGIGRFALARLSKETTMITRKNGEENSIKWYTDWLRTDITSDLDKSEQLKESGTKFILRQLRESWDDSSVNNLKEFLSRSYNGKNFSIKIDYGGVIYPVRDIFYHPKVGINYTSKIKFNYNTILGELSIDILCDEFDSKIAKIISNKSFPIHERKMVNVQKYFETNSVYRKKKNDIYGEKLKKLLNELGDFSGELYFNLQNISRIDKERFFYKYNTLRKKFDAGVILYRNSFSISSYDGSKDWLRLAKRASESPAAASHPTGKWRVNTSQLSGKVLIDRRKNSYLKDLSNRQGLDENQHYHLFIDVISIILSNFEEFRQEIIRQLKIYSDEGVTKSQNTKKESLKDIIKTPETILNLDSKSLVKVAKDFSSYAINSSIIEKGNKEKEEKYIYEIRILNVLATSGLKAMSIAHELDNKRNNLSSNYNHIVKALKKYNMWSDLLLEENRKRSHSNVPRLLDQNKKVNEKLVTFLDTILEEVETQFFDTELVDVDEFIFGLVQKWRIDYPSVKSIAYKNIGKENLFCISKDILNVIFDNLILNSIQQNEKKMNELNLWIEYELKDEVLFIKYKDDGIGLSNDYLDEPFKILDIHESSRENGHGLGMWIVNNSVISSEGKVTNISGQNGFCFECVLLEQKEEKVGGKYE